MKRISIIAGCLILAACASPTIEDTQPITSVKIEVQVATTAERAACDTAGGSISRQGMLGYELCVIPYGDAGKICQDASDCAGRCFADPKLDSGETITATSGVCEPDNNPLGCYATIEDGTGTPMLCVD